MRVILVTLILSILLIPFSSINAQTSPNGQTLKALTYNIGTWDSSDVNFTKEARLSRMQRLAQFIKTENIEVVLLQEFSNRYYDNYTTTDLQDLIQILSQIGYPMDYVYSDYEEDNPNGAILLTLSKYPINKSSLLVNYKIRHNRSTHIVEITNTPIGNFKVGNLHTHNTQACENFTTAVNFLFSVDPTNTILGGDTNLALVEQVDPKTNSCKSFNFSTINISCSNTNLCLTTNQPWPTAIDWFFVNQNSNIFIESSYYIDNGDNRLQISDQHPAIITNFGSTKPNLTKDFNGDGVVNIRDVIFLIKKLYAS